MVQQNPKQAIIDYLSATQVILSETTDPGGWSKKETTGGLGAKQETIHFLKERSLPHRQVHFVTFEDKQGYQRYFTCQVVEENDGKWKMDGGAGGADWGRRGTQRASPQVNLGCGSWPNQFYAGGYVEDQGETVLVRLLSSNGTLMEDTVEEDGIVLFLSDQPVELPLQAMLYDRQGSLLNTHKLFDF